jgi:hypothetical protein
MILCAKRSLEHFYGKLDMTKTFLPLILILLLCLTSCMDGSKPNNPGEPNNPSEPNNTDTCQAINSNNNLWPVKISRAGYRYGGGRGGSGIATDPNNNVYVFGNIFPENDTSSDSTIHFLTKIDPNGNVIWSKDFPDKWNGYYLQGYPKLTFGKDGEVYLYTSKTVTLPQSGDAPTQKIVNFVMKELDSQGNQASEITFFSSNDFDAKAPRMTDFGVDENKNLYALVVR